MKASKSARELLYASVELRRALLGLDTIRVMGRVESECLGGEGGQIGMIFQELERLHQKIIPLLDELGDSNEQTEALVQRFNAAFS